MGNAGVVTGKLRQFCDDLVLVNRYPFNLGIPGIVQVNGIDLTIEVQAFCRSLNNESSVAIEIGAQYT